MKVKYPRTFHLPWSEGITNDDKVLSNCNHFLNQEVVVTEKLDGENTTLMRDWIHARSVDSVHHYTQDWVKAFWYNISYRIPEGWRICGENLFAEHSIPYDNLASYFYGFSIWDENNYCLSWDATLEWFEELGITPVPELYRGVYNEDILKSLWFPESNKEGYVVRLADGYDYLQFSTSIGKFVRKNHVNDADDHWLYGNKEIKQNSLA